MLGDMHCKTLEMRNDYFHARSLFEHGFLIDSHDMLGMFYIILSKPGMDGHISPVV